jgi:hypothetical protein
MPFGTVPNGAANRLYVGTSAPPNVLVGGLQGWEYGGEGETTEETFYNDFAAITTVGDPVNDASFSGKWADGDSGLIILKNAYGDQSVIYAGFVPNGTDGEYMPCRVSRFRLTGGGVEQAAGYQFSLVQADDLADIGGGLS